jgi:hypothetical protein
VFSRLQTNSISKVGARKTILFIEHLETRATRQAAKR